MSGWGFEGVKGCLKGYFGINVQERELRGKKEVKGSTRKLREAKKKHKRSGSKY